MIAVIFEVEPGEGNHATYLSLATQLRPMLVKMDGFLSVERFQSLSNPSKLLSLSFWRDEASVIAWREHTAHRIAQSQGRSGVFDAYRLRVATVMRDYGLYERNEAPPYHAPIEAPYSCPFRPLPDKE